VKSQRCKATTSRDHLVALRGDEKHNRTDNLPEGDSPHTRGWTDPPVGGHSPARGFPTHAGMDRPRDGIRPRWLPDSPHTRGWTAVDMAYFDALLGFPTHAGMDRATSSGVSATCGIPYTRGDGPTGAPSRSISCLDSPHARGWTGISTPISWRCSGIPHTRAGMDRNGVM
jgi:hypothetical protein